MFWLVGCYCNCCCSCCCFVVIMWKPESYVWDGRTKMGENTTRKRGSCEEEAGMSERGGEKEKTEEERESVLQ